MKQYHIILEEDIPDTIPIIVKNYSIAGILSLGMKKAENPFFNIYNIEIEIHTFKNPSVLAAQIINNIRLLKDIDIENLVIAITGNNPTIILSLYLVAQAFSATSYTIIQQEIIVLPSLSIIKISEDEFNVLKELEKIEAIDSMGELVERMEWGDKDNGNIIAKMAYCARKLRAKRFVETSKEGRSVKLRITPSGMQYVQLFGNKSNKSKKKVDKITM